MEGQQINTDRFILELGGCGRFQVVICFLVYVVYIPWSFSMLFMSFGAYNPGWRCLDNITDLNQTANFSSEYQVDTCHGYNNCQNVQFNPEASTVVTEFGLICDRSWLMSLTMTLQMVGALVGTLLVGSLGDRLGRRTTLYLFLSFNIVFQVVCMFSASMEMFIALRFLIGICGSVLGYLPITLIMEYVPPKWRVIIACIPGWAVGNIMFTSSALLTKDWSQLHLIVAFLSLACLCSVFWVPESLRWLAVHGKEKKCLNLSKRIAHMNKGFLNREHCARLIKQEASSKSTTKEYGFLDLFRKGYRLYPICLGVPFLFIDMFYFTMTFGVSKLPGDLYVTLFIMGGMEFPGNIVAVFLPNKFGRKFTASVGLFLMSMSLFSMTAVALTATGQTEVVATLTLLLVSKVSGTVAWNVMNVIIAELYPTVIRSTATGYGGFMGVLGSIISPFLIPSEGSNFYISYLIFAIVALVCSGLLLLLPETKGKPLLDTWESKLAADEIEANVMA